MIRKKAPLIFGVGAIVALGVYIAAYRSSPGELSQAHFSVAGTSYIGDCKKCHADKDVTKGCLSCHEEIQAQISKGKGLHAQFAAEKKSACASCHSEHNGRAFSLVNKISWGGKDFHEFTHAHTDFHLTGKHVSLACADCHEKHAKSFSLSHYPTQIRTKTYLGLHQNCADCHKDVHAGGLAAGCQDCHGQEAFRPASLFNHEKFFSLTEGHARLTCQGCHPIPAGTQAPLSLPRGFPFNVIRGTKCVDCHKNPHAVAWKQSCESCHTARAVPWAAANAKVSRSAHALTGFHLEPPHQKVACTQCHESSRTFAKKYSDPKTGRPRREKDCESCHRDPHAGQFVAAHPRCVDCHSSKSFTPARLTVADHKVFPLMGRHATVACNACHRKDSKTGIRIFTPMKHDCASCHVDIHFGQFKTNGTTRCENCHVDAASWKRLIFNHNIQSRFKLDSAHQNVACKNCHPAVTLKSGKRTIQYKPLRMRCVDCHEVNE